MTRVRFGDVVQHKTTTADPTADGISRYVAIEHLDPKTLTVERWGDVSDGTTFTRLFGPGDVLFSKRRAYQRKAARVSFEGVCSGDLLVFSARPDHLRPDLLPFVVQSDAFFEHALRTSAGSLSPRTKWQDLAAFEFDLPSAAEQSQLAAMLTQTETARSAWRSVSAKSDALRRACARAVIGNGSWPIVPVRDIAAVSNGTTPSRKNPAYWSGGEVPWLPTGKAHDREITMAEEFVTDLALKECSLRLVPAGSILVAMIGQGKTRGTAAYLHIEATINQNFAAVVPGGNVDNRFLFHVLSSSYDALRHASQGSSQGALNCRLIGDFKVPLPPMDEQLAIVQRLDDLVTAVDEAGTQAERIATLQRALISYQLMPNDVH